MQYSWEQIITINSRQTGLFYNRYLQIWGCMSTKMYF